MQPSAYPAKTGQSGDAAKQHLQALMVPGPDECRLPQKSTTVLRFAPDPLSLRHTVGYKGGKGGKKSKGGKAPK